MSADSRKDKGSSGEASHPKIRELAEMAEIKTAESGSKVDGFSSLNDYSLKMWLNSAQQVKKNADIDLASGKEEAAYVLYLKFCNIMVKVIPNLPEFKDSKKAVSKNSLSPQLVQYKDLKRMMPSIITSSEKIRANIIATYSTKAKSDQNKIKSKADSDTSKSNLKTTRQTPEKIPAHKLHSYLSWRSPPKFLILDCRSRQDFLNQHISGCHLVNIDTEQIIQKKLGEGMDVKDLSLTCDEIASSLPSSPSFHRLNFSNRHSYDLVIYTDQSSRFINDSVVLGDSKSDLTSIGIKLVRDALHRETSADDSSNDKFFKRNPALLVGGMNEWRRLVVTSSLRLVHGLEAGDKDGALEEKAVKLHHTSARIHREKNQNEPDSTENVADGNKLKNLRLDNSESFKNAPSSNDAKSNWIFGPSNSSSSLGFPNIPNAFAYNSSKEIQDDDRPLGPLYPDAPKIQPLSSSGMKPTTSQLSKNYNPSVFQNLEKVKPMQPNYVGINHQTGSTLPKAPLQKVSSINKPVPALPTPNKYQSNTEIAVCNRTSSMRGLNNLGNTCYMNSIIQCVLGTGELMNYFVSPDGKSFVEQWKSLINTSNPISSKGRLAAAFSSLTHQMYKSPPGSYISPYEFKKVVSNTNSMFQGTEQHDSQEFLAFLLDGLHEDFNRGLGVNGGKGYAMREIPSWAADSIEKEEDSSDSDDYDEEYYQRPENVKFALNKEIKDSYTAWARYLFRNDSLIVSLFQGQLKSQLQCLTCSKTSTTYNPFMYLSLPIPRNTGSTSLSRCLDEFVREEVLDDADSWRCPRCKRNRRASKKLSISRVPPILLIQLKRFSASGELSNKIDSFVDFPVSSELDLWRFLSPGLKSSISESAKGGQIKRPPHKYRLYAVSNHFGGLNGGHYTAFVKNELNNPKAWFEYDDSRVRKICPIERSNPQNAKQQSSAICTKAAYSLFYVSA